MTTLQTTRPASPEALVRHDARAQIDTTCSTSTGKNLYTARAPRAYARVPLNGRAHANARRRALRLTCKGALTQLCSGAYRDTTEWNQHSVDRRILEKILAVSAVHPDWTLSSVSAAALYGHVSRLGLHRRVHFTSDEHTASARRSVMPVRFHHVKNGRLHSFLERSLLFISAQMSRQMLLDDFGERGYADREDVARNYMPLSDTLGLLFGILVTSPLQTMFDCARMLPFSDALPVCDYIARVFCISRDEIREFLDKRRGCWKIRYARFVLGFVDARSENGGESFCRARMIESGFVLPELQQSMANPLSAPEFITTARYTTMTMRADYMWKGAKTIVAEFDGQCKYTNPAMIASVGARDGDDVREIQAERDTALKMIGCEVVHVTYADIRYNRGRALRRKLLSVGVPEVSYWEKYRREHWLARGLHARVLVRLE